MLMRTMGYPDTTELFIEAGADVNIKDKRDARPLTLRNLFPKQH